MCMHIMRIKMLIKYILSAHVLYVLWTLSNLFVQPNDTKLAINMAEPRSRVGRLSIVRKILWYNIFHTCQLLWHSAGQDFHIYCAIEYCDVSYHFSVSPRTYILSEWPNIYAEFPSRVHTSLPFVCDYHILIYSMTIKLNYEAKLSEGLVSIHVFAMSDVLNE